MKIFKFLLPALLVISCQKDATSTQTMVETETEAAQKSEQEIAGKVSSKEISEEEKIQNAYPNMSLVWQDEFNGAELDRKKWVVLDRFASAKKSHLYFRDHEDNVRIEDGKLVLEAHKVDMPNPQKGRAWKESLKNDKRFTRESIPLSSGRVQTADKHKVLSSWKYGRIDVRAKLSSVKGTHAAIWTMGEHYFDINWPRAGEIDILEHLGRNPGAAWNVIHRGNEEGKDAPVNNNGKKPYPGKSLADGKFHTFSVVWNEKEIIWYCDDVETFRYDTSVADVSYDIKGKKHGNPFHMPHFLILDLTVGGWGGKWDANDMPARLEFDYVRVYQ